MPTTYTVKEIGRNGSIDDKGVRTYTRVFYVITSNPGDGPLLITSQVPFALYESYNLGPGNDVDLAAILKKVDTQPEDIFAGKWLVTLTYDSARNDVDTGATEPGLPGTSPSEPGEGQNATSPELRPWVIKWGSVQTERLLVRDVSAEEKPLATSAGQPFDPPISVPCCDVTLSVTAWTATINAANVWRFFNKVNQFTLFGVWPPGWARCTAYTQTSMYENGAFYWQTDFTLQFREDGWNPIRVLDAGTLYKKSNSLPLQPILDRAGNPVSSPVPLDGFGEPLKAGDEPVYLEFQGYYEEDFAELI